MELKKYSVTSYSSAISQKQLYMFLSRFLDM